MSASHSTSKIGFGLWRYALIGAVIAFAGPPIYIHVPKVYGELQGLNLGVMALILMALRLFDVVQDPVIGWLVSRFQTYMTRLVFIFAILFGSGMLMLFAPDPPLNLAMWFAISLGLVYTGFSGLQIIFYSTGLDMAEAGGLSHARIAAWREAAILIGVSAACVLPVWLALKYGELNAYWAFSLLFVFLLGLALLLSWKVWRFAGNFQRTPIRFWHLFKRGNIRWLMLVGFLNSIPTGITSTLFLFYAESRLEAGIHTGPMLLVFFLSAAASAPLWGFLAARYSARKVLMVGMILVIPAFISAAFLGTGDIFAFYVICILSGIAMGADMTLLPALLSDELVRGKQGGSFTFGIWGFITKLSFATGAGLALISLWIGGFDPAGINDEIALRHLAYSYALLPCLMKLLAIITIWRAPLHRGAI